MGSLLNTFLFILFMLYQIRKHMNENERIMMLNESLKEANIKLEEYSKSSALMAQTAERNRLAREIHDTIGHSLTGIVTGLDACLMMFDKDRDLVKTQLGAIAEVARTGMTDVRQSVKALRPDALEKLPLDEAIEKLIDEMGRSTGVNIDYHCQGKLSDSFDETEEETIYRTIQESITNAISHGNASNINIDIKRSEDNLLTIDIKDNGSGSTNPQKGFGLTHMEERLSMLGGSLSIDGSDGFRVRARMPIRWGQERSSI
ncbi:MAG: sensor histidine kinase [Lachnospiraceae bacterium]|nr:sensor histidine kinase [Lachnospiraceae bacterium]